MFSETVVGAVYDKSIEEAIQLETVAGGFIASILFATRQDGVVGNVLLVVSAFFFLLIVYRQAAVSTLYGSISSIRQSQRLLEFFMVISFFHFTYHINQILPEFLHDIFSNFTILILTLIFFSFTFLIFDLSYNAYRLLWGSIFYAQAINWMEKHQNSQFSGKISPFKTISGLFQIMAYFSLKDNALPDVDRPEINELDDFLNEFRKSADKVRFLWLRTIMVIAILTVFFFGPLALAGSFLTGSLGEAIVVISTVYILRHIFRVFSLSLGTGRFVDLFLSDFRNYIYLALYSLCVWLLYFQLY